MLFIVSVYLLSLSVLFVKENGDNNFTRWFLYNEVEEFENKNNIIRELNRLSKEQLELLKENDNYRKEAKDYLAKNKIF